MAIDELELDLLPVVEPTAEAAAYMAEADRRIDSLFNSGENRKIPRYLPSHTTQVYSALVTLTKEELPEGGIFCEWGAGYGIVAGLASMMGYEAHGIEIEEIMVERAESLAKHAGLDVQFHCGSIEPEGYEFYHGVGGHELVEPEQQMLGGDPADMHPTYPGIDHPIEDIDLFFIYPWPGQQEMIHEFFDAVAGEGALLLCYYGESDLVAYRKVWE